ncbi:MAG TPA: hypothetical protein VGN99_00800, partial [Steroidobacteraceae bacterium]|nr:hypothetical protein [Steroidobacteraceae bacterium]
FACQDQDGCWVETQEWALGKGDISMPDARLIAAAPELLDLARNIAGLDWRYLDQKSGPLFDAMREWQQQARAVIAKIEGKQ